MKSEETKSGWNHVGSEFYHGKKNKDGKVVDVFSGRYVCNEIEMTFHAVEQAPGSHQLRGTISAISPLDGCVMQVVGRERSKRLDSLVNSGKYPNREEAETHRNKLLNVSRSFYGSAEKDDEVKALIKVAAEKLFAKNAALMQRALQTTSHPNSITPCVAYAAYIDEFFWACYLELKPSSARNYRSQINELMRALPNKPMPQIMPSEVSSCIKKLNYSKAAIRRAYLFWQFLLDAHYCSGNNPIPSNIKRRISAEVRQEKSKRPCCLDLPLQDKLFAKLSSGKVSGASCGIALKAWGGDDIPMDLTWGNVHFDSVDQSLVVIDIQKPDQSGATHDYAHPMIPFGALVLAKRYQQLLNEFTPEELKEAPVVSESRNALAQLSNEGFLSHINRTLRNIGVPPSMLESRKGQRTAAGKTILSNTYVNDIYTRIGFDDDTGTKEFLCCERIKDVTSDNYTKFNDPDGIARIHAAESILSPLMDIYAPEKIETLPDGRIKYTFWPDNTRKTVGLGMDLFLAPDTEGTVCCAHGADIEIKSRAVNTDGTIRRKTGPRTKRSEVSSDISTAASACDGIMPEGHDTNELPVSNGTPSVEILPAEDTSANEDSFMTKAKERSEVTKEAVQQPCQGNIPADKTQLNHAEKLESIGSTQHIRADNTRLEDAIIKTKQRLPKKEPLMIGQDALF